MREKKKLEKPARGAGGVENLLLKNAAHIFSTSVVTSCLGFLFLIIATHLFSPEFVGLNQTIISASSAIAAVALFGFNMTMLTFLPKSGEKEKLINTMFSFSLLVALALSVGYLFFFDILVPNQNIFGGPIFELAFVALTAVSIIGVMLDTLFTAIRTAKYALTRNIILSAGRIPMIFLPIGNFVWLVSIIVPAIVSIWYTRSALLAKKITHRFRLVVSKKTLQEVGLLSASNSISWGFTYIFLWIFLTMINHSLGLNEAAYFSVAWTIATLIFVAPLSISQSLICEAGHNEKETKYFVRKSVKYSLMFLIPVVAVLSLLGPYVLALFGSGYAAASSALTILLGSSFFIAGISIYSAIQNLKKRPASIFFVNLARIALIPLFSFMFMPAITIEKVALAWLAGNGIVFVFTTIRTAQDFGGGPDGD